MPTQHEKHPDEKRIVASLAAECHMPIAEMATLYEKERAELASGARNTKFLHIFASRSVREVLRKRSLEEQNSAPAKPASPAV